MSQMTEADLERAQFEAEAEGEASGGFWARLRAYLPGSAPKDKWGEPSAVPFYHNVHKCGFM